MPHQQQYNGGWFCTDPPIAINILDDVPAQSTRKDLTSRIVAHTIATKSGEAVQEVEKSVIHAAIIASFLTLSIVVPMIALASEAGALPAIVVAVIVGIPCMLMALIYAERWTKDILRKQLSTLESRHLARTNPRNNAAGSTSTREQLYVAIRRAISRVRLESPVVMDLTKEQYVSLKEGALKIKERALATKTEELKQKEEELRATTGGVTNRDAEVPVAREVRLGGALQNLVVFMNESASEMKQVMAQEAENGYFLELSEMVDGLAYYDIKMACREASTVEGSPTTTSDSPDNLMTWDGEITPAELARELVYWEDEYFNEDKGSKAVSWEDEDSDDDDEGSDAEGDYVTCGCGGTGMQC